jgi:hypothetical protein
VVLCSLAPYHRPVVRTPICNQAAGAGKFDLAAFCVMIISLQQAGEGIKIQFHSRFSTCPVPVGIGRFSERFLLNDIS